MKFIFIVPSEEMLPSKALLEKLAGHGEIGIIKHTGRLSDLVELKNDTADKILAVDPSSFGSDLDADSIKDIPNVKAVMPSTTGFDWIKPEVLKSLGVVACNDPGFSTDSVAEYAVAMAIEVSRRLPMIIKNGWKMDLKDQKPRLLKGRVAGIIGLGRIGTRVAEICSGIGMKVIYYSKNSSDARFKKVELNQLFSDADLIIPALAVNTETKKLLTNELLDLIKPTTVLVGIGRVRDLWDESYILTRVEQEKLAGYAFEDEKAKDSNSYTGNILALPSIAWYTQESFDNMMIIWIENMIAFANNKPQNVVN